MEQTIKKQLQNFKNKDYKEFMKLVIEVLYNVELDKNKWNEFVEAILFNFYDFSNAEILTELENTILYDM